MYHFERLSDLQNFLEGKTPVAIEVVKSLDNSSKENLKLSIHVIDNNTTNVQNIILDLSCLDNSFYPRVLLKTEPAVKGVVYAVEISQGIVYSFNQRIEEFKIHVLGDCLFVQINTTDTKTELGFNVDSLKGIEGFFNVSQRYCQEANTCEMNEKYVIKLGLDVENVKPIYSII